MRCSSGPGCVGIRRLQRHWRDCSAWILGALFCLQSWHGSASFANATFTHCVRDDFSDLYIMVEANVSNAQGPTNDDLIQALTVACARVGGCRQTERDQAMDMLIKGWSDEEWNKNRATAAAMGISVVALAMNYALDRSVTISYQSPSLNNETRFRLGPSQDVDCAVAVHCHKLGLHLTDPACFEAAYYARVGRAQVPPGAWCMDSKDAIHTFTRRLLDQHNPLPSSSKWTQLQRRRELYDALEHEYNVTAPSDMTLRGELTWHASLLPPQDNLYDPELPLQVQLHYRPPANTTGGRPVHVLDLSAVAQFLGEPLYVATRLSGCPWSVSTVHPSSSLDTHEAPLLVSCDARPLAVDDVNGGRLVGLQVFESSRLAPLSHLMAVAGKQQRPSPPPPEVAPYRSPALYPPSFAATLTPRELKADAVVLDKALASLVERDRGQEAVQAFRDVYAFDEKGTRLPSDIVLHWIVFRNQDRYVTMLAGCERLANAGSLGDFLKCLDMRTMDEMMARMKESEATHCTQASIARNGILRVADLDKALASALLAGGRFSVDRWQRLKQWAEELVMPTWEVLAVETTTDKLAFHGYQRFYGPAFATLRSSAVRVMELGSREGSVHLWPRVFPGGRFILVDILFADNCQPCRLGDGMWGHRVDLHDEEEVERLAEAYASSDKQVDVIVDDGSHLPFAQVLGFKYLFEKALKPGGLFVIEDTELSYHARFKAHSLFPHMLSVVDIINREYTDPLLSHPALGEVASLVSSVAFGQNCIILRKKDEADEPFNGRVYHMRRFVQNYTVGGYEEEVALRRFTLKEEQPPQHPDLIEDGVAKFRWSRVDIPGTAVV